MGNILPAVLGGLLSIILVISLHFATIYIPALASYSNHLALLSILLGLVVATLSTSWFNKKKKDQNELSYFPTNTDFTLGALGHPSSDDNVDSTRSISSEKINYLSTIPLNHTTAITSTIDANQVSDDASNEIASAVDLNQVAELGEKLSEGIGEVVSSILE